MMVVHLFFFLKMNEAWPNAPSLQIDAWLFENLDIWGKDDDLKKKKNGWGMAEWP